MNVKELWGTAVGWTWAPAIAVVAALKRARFFHPEGVCYLATVSALSEEALAQDMSGSALVRMSTALWRYGKEWPDVLGCAIRFGWSGEEQANLKTQDLLFATARSPLTVWVAPISTKVHDYLANHYFAVSPFHAPGLGRVKWRLRPSQPPPVLLRQTRNQRLQSAVESESAVLTLEFAQGILDDWHPFARVELREPVTLDQAKLRFSPFRNGLGIKPVGYVHALRHGAYAASQMARPDHSPG